MAINDTRHEPSMFNTEYRGAYSQSPLAASAYNAISQMVWQNMLGQAGPVQFAPRVMQGVPGYESYYMQTAMLGNIESLRNELTGQAFERAIPALEAAGIKDTAGLLALGGATLPTVQQFLPLANIAKPDTMLRTLLSTMAMESGMLPESISKVGEKGGIEGAEEGIRAEWDRRKQRGSMYLDAITRGAEYYGVNQEDAMQMGELLMRSGTFRTLPAGEDEYGAWVGRGRHVAEMTSVMRRQGANVFGQGLSIEEYVSRTQETFGSAALNDTNPAELKNKFDQVASLAAISKQGTERLLDVFKSTREVLANNLEQFGGLDAGGNAIAGNGTLTAVSMQATRDYAALMWGKTDSPENRAKAMAGVQALTQRQLSSGLHASMDMAATFMTSGGASSEAAGEFLTAIRSGVGERELGKMRDDMLVAEFGSADVGKKILLDPALQRRYKEQVEYRERTRFEGKDREAMVKETADRLFGTADSEEKAAFVERHKASNATYDVFKTEVAQEVINTGRARREQDMTAKRERAIEGLQKEYVREESLKLGISGVATKEDRQRALDDAVATSGDSDVKVMYAALKEKGMTGPALERAMQGMGGAGADVVEKAHRQATAGIAEKVSREVGEHGEVRALTKQFSALLTPEEKKAINIALSKKDIEGAEKLLDEAMEDEDVKDIYKKRKAESKRKQFKTDKTGALVETIIGESVAEQEAVKGLSAGKLEAFEKAQKEGETISNAPINKEAADQQNKDLLMRQGVSKAGIAAGQLLQLQFPDRVSIVLTDESGNGYMELKKSAGTQR